MATNHLESAADYPVFHAGARPLALCPGGEELVPGLRCFHDAYVGGVDGRWRSKSGEWVAVAQVVGTLIQNGPPRVQPDGVVIRSGDAGPAVSLKAAKEGGKVVAQVDYEGYGKKVDFNDLGYMQRQNLHKAHGVVEYRTLDPRGPTLETHTFLEVSERDNLDGLNQQRQVMAGNYTRFKNFWGVFAAAHARAPRYDDREVGDGAALERTALGGFEVWVTTDARKRLSGELWAMIQGYPSGFNFQGDGRVSVRILPQFDVDLLPTWIYTDGEPRYFATQGTSYLFGRQRAQSVGVTLRSTYTVTPRLSIQAYAQLFLDAVHFHDYSSFPARGAGTVIHLKELRPLTSPVAENPDYEHGVFNANLVLRWEYLLGSTIYVVYTHAQDSSLVPLFNDAAGFNFRLIRPRPAEDALLFKLSYWWG